MSHSNNQTRNPKCFGRFSEDELGRHSVECDYCGKYDTCTACSKCAILVNDLGVKLHGCSGCIYKNEIQ